MSKLTAFFCGITVYCAGFLTCLYLGDYMVRAKAREVEIQRLNLVVRCQQFAISQSDLLVLVTWEQAKILNAEQETNRKACIALREAK